MYWIPLFEILEQRGIRPCLVNARHMKNVPGRRTDWHECQWLQFLHPVGLLRAAFRPGQDVCAVRTVLRHRNELVSAASQHVSAPLCDTRGNRWPRERAGGSPHALRFTTSNSGCESEGVV